MLCTLKNVEKTWEVELAVKMNARNVLKPPLSTAGPMSLRVFMDLSSPEPEENGIKENFFRYAM